MRIAKHWSQTPKVIFFKETNLQTISNRYLTNLSVTETTCSRSLLLTIFTRIPEVHVSTWWVGGGGGGGRTGVTLTFKFDDT
jgi:hypothetical protein